VHKYRCNVDSHIMQRVGPDTLRRSDMQRFWGQAGHGILRPSPLGSVTSRNAPSPPTRGLRPGQRGAARPGPAAAGADRARRHPPELRNSEDGGGRRRNKRLRRNQPFFRRRPPARGCGADPLCKTGNRGQEHHLVSSLAQVTESHATGALAMGCARAARCGRR
jgi:hypothetical protein